MKKTILCLICVGIFLLAGGCKQINTPGQENDAHHDHEHTQEENKAPSIIQIETVTPSEIQAISEEEKAIIDRTLGKDSNHVASTEAVLWVSAYHKEDLGIWVAVCNYDKLSESEQNQIIYRIGRDTPLVDNQRAPQRSDFGSFSLFTTSSELTEKIGAYLNYMNEIKIEVQDVSQFEECLNLLAGKEGIENATE